MAPVIRVWRESGDKRLSTFAKKGSRSPYASGVSGDIKVLDSVKFKELVSSGEPFDEVYVSIADALEVIGWEIS